MPSPPLPWLWLAASLWVVFGAGVVRGFAGFGFSALCVAGMSLYLPPALVVPPVFVLEVLASLSLLRGAWKHVDWPWLGWLIAGNALCIPLGVALLAFVAETPLRALIGALLLAAALLLRSGRQLKLAPTHGLRLATGMVCGLVNGVAAIGGIAVAVMLSAAPMAPAVMRATLIWLFLFTDLYALAWAALMPASAAGELLGANTGQLVLWLAPAMLAGIWIGQRAFTGVSPERFRRWVLNLLVAIAGMAVLRALFELLR